ncbi:hypothetical protein QAD02_011060 [Eretmocerus hayati]|uniref:Uncharacterized protein n=1 Tax=Eretmocerus hayati TaxID=131215 RepID=A0ACC2NYB1_9HYME|nr:hypothetical protein QAD02_011060 [Eretmocerus hayati]
MTDVENMLMTAAQSSASMSPSSQGSSPGGQMNPGTSNGSSTSNGNVIVAPGGSSPPEWYASYGHPGHHHFHNAAASHHHHQQYLEQHDPLLEWSGDEVNGDIGAGEPSPPITVSGSEMSNPGTPASPSATNVTAQTLLNNNSISVTNNNGNSAGVPRSSNGSGGVVHGVPLQSPENGNSVGIMSGCGAGGHGGVAHHMRPSANRSPYEWIKKSSFPTQPNPGKTRTKDKYRVVYTEHQRLELEKEFYSSKYITIRRKAELAASLALSERQVKIWFQNRRAKERKQCKKRGELIVERDVKPILDAHGVAHPPPPPVGSMAGLTLGSMGMSDIAIVMNFLLECDEKLDVEQSDDY